MNHIRFDELVENAISSHKPLKVRDQLDEADYKKFIFQMILHDLRESMGLSVNLMANLMNMTPEEYEAIEHPITFNIVTDDVFHTLEAQFEYAYNKYPQSKSDTPIDTVPDHSYKLLSNEAVQPKYRHEAPWVIHIADVRRVINNNMIVMEYPELGDLKAFDQDFEKKVAEIYPLLGRHAHERIAMLAYNFSIKMKKGDYIILPAKDYSKIHIGVVNSDYYYARCREFAHRRRVEWIEHLSTDKLPGGILNELHFQHFLFKMRTVKMDQFMAIATEGEV